MLQGTIIIAVPPFLIVYLRPTHKIRILRTLYLFPLRGITAQATSFGSPCSSQNHSQLPFIPRSHLCATLWDDKTDATFFAHRIWCFILFCYNTTYKNACQEEILKINSNDFEADPSPLQCKCSSFSSREDPSWVCGFRGCGRPIRRSTDSRPS